MTIDNTSRNQRFAAFLPKDKFNKPLPWLYQSRYDINDSQVILNLFYPKSDSRYYYCAIGYDSRYDYNFIDGIGRSKSVKFETSNIFDVDFNTGKLLYEAEKFSVDRSRTIIKNNSIDYNCIGWAIGINESISDNAIYKSFYEVNLKDKVESKFKGLTKKFKINNNFKVILPDKTYSPKEGDIGVYCAKCKGQLEITHMSLFYDINSVYGASKELKWTSKLGDKQLITHTIYGLDCPIVENYEIYTIGKIPYGKLEAIITFDEVKNMIGDNYYKYLKEQQEEGKFRESYDKAKNELLSLGKIRNIGDLSLNLQYLNGKELIKINLGHILANFFKQANSNLDVCAQVRNNKEIEQLIEGLKFHSKVEANNMAYETNIKHQLLSMMFEEGLGQDARCVINYIFSEVFSEFIETELKLTEESFETVVEYGESNIEHDIRILGQAIADYTSEIDEH